MLLGDQWGVNIMSVKRKEFIDAIVTWRDDLSIRDKTYEYFISFISGKMPELANVNAENNEAKICKYCLLDKDELTKIHANASKVKKT